MNEQVKIKVREPAVAGQFYPAKDTQLKDELRSLFNQASVKTDRNM